MKARLPKGASGGAPQNMQAMIKQAQQMQQQMEQKQAAIQEQEFKATSGGGAVSVIMTGARELKQLDIRPDVVDPDDIEMLQDLIIGAVNECSRMIEQTTSSEMGGITGGLNIPGL